MRERDEDEPDHPGHPERPEGRHLDRARVRELLADEPHGAHSGGVGAAHAVGVVVGVVDPHLQGEGDEKGQHGIPQPARPASWAAAVPMTTGATAAGRVRGRAPAIHWFAVAMAQEGPFYSPLRKSGSSSGPRGRGGAFRWAC